MFQDVYCVDVQWLMALAAVSGGCFMGVLFVRMGPGSYVSAQASDQEVVYLFNSGINTWTIGPTTDDGPDTGASGTRASSTDRYPLPSPPM